MNIFVFCGSSGLAYDFVIYLGGSTEIDSSILRNYGHAAGVVVHFTLRVPVESQHKLFFGNYFSSFKLFTYLKEKGIPSAGSVRSNRFGKPPFIFDAELKKRGGGSMDVVCSKGEEFVCIVLLVMMTHERLNK